MNSKFEYLYRDGSNYKSWGEVTFSGRASDELRLRIVSALDRGEFFIADQVRIPDMFFENRALFADDHCWHELSNVSDTLDQATDVHRRKLEEFVSEVEAAVETGWRVFDPLERERPLSR